MGMLTCSEDDDIVGNIPWTRACRDVYDLVSTRRFTATSPCIKGKFQQARSMSSARMLHWLNSSTIVKIEMSRRER
jgi:hypothetical protein